MDATPGRRAFLGSLSTASIALAGCAFLDLDSGPSETFRTALSLESYHSLWSDGDAYFVAARTGDEEVVTLIRVSLDGEVEWRRDVLGGLRQDPVFAHANRSDGGQLLLTKSALVRIDDDGRREWAESIEIESSLDRPDYLATTFAAAPDGGSYVAGSNLVERVGAGGTTDDYEPWIRKYSASGEIEWTRRPEIESYSGTDNDRGIGVLEARDDGVRLGLLRVRDDRNLVVLDLDESGQVQDRFERSVPRPSQAYRSTPSGYVGVTERNPYGDEYYEIIEADESLSITNRFEPDVPERFEDFVRLDDGEYLTWSEGLVDGSTTQYHSRVASDGTVVWTKETDGWDLATAGDQFATLDGYEIVGYTEH